jgi:sugar phosphate isomerase/epimerase
VRKLALARVKKSIDACHSLGGEVVVVHPGHCPIREVKELLNGARDRYREFVEECWKHARGKGVTLTVENIDRADFPYSTVDEIKQLAEEFDGLGITFDVGHAYLASRKEGAKAPEKEIVKAIKKAGDHLAHVHIHDNEGLRDDHLPPGDGDIDFRPIVDVLESMRYDGQLIVELWDPKNSLKTGEKGLKNIRKLLRIS